MIVQDFLRFVGFVFVLVSLIVVGDICGKLFGQYGVDLVFIVFFRFFIGVVVILLISGLCLLELIVFLDWRILLCGVFIIGGILLILMVLKIEFIVDVFGVFFIGFVVVYVLVILLLNECFIFGCSLFFVVGFVGVMFVVKSGFGM